MFTRERLPYHRTVQKSRQLGLCHPQFLCTQDALRHSFLTEESAFQFLAGRGNAIYACPTQNVPWIIQYAGPVLHDTVHRLPTIFFSMEHSQAIGWPVQCHTRLFQTLFLHFRAFAGDGIPGNAHILTSSAFFPLNMFKTNLNNCGHKICLVWWLRAELYFTMQWRMTADRPQRIHYQVPLTRHVKTRWKCAWQ